MYKVIMSKRVEKESDEEPSKPKGKRYISKQKEFIENL